MHRGRPKPRPVPRAPSGEPAAGAAASTPASAGAASSVTRAAGSAAFVFAPLAHSLRRFIPVHGDRDALVLSLHRSLGLRTRERDDKGGGGGGGGGDGDGDTDAASSSASSGAEDTLAAVRFVEAAPADASVLEWFHTREYLLSLARGSLTSGESALAAGAGGDAAASAAARQRKRRRADAHEPARACASCGPSADPAAAAYLRAAAAAGDGDGDDSSSDDSSSDTAALRWRAASRSGLEDDCPAFPGVFAHALSLAGGALAAAAEVLAGRSAAALFFQGGRHHAHKAQAKGFCYVNDAVLCILALQRGGCERIAYLDIDVHHGDGVEAAFLPSSHVLTASVHRFGKGFFPGTGRASQPHRRCINVPLRRGCSDDTFHRVFTALCDAVWTSFAPTAVVLQCGVDGLAGDPLGDWNLSSRAFERAVRLIRGYGTPAVILGGGGYRDARASVTWARVTCAVAGVEPPEVVPEHEDFGAYGPDFLLRANAVPHVHDDNDPAYVSSVVQGLQRIAASHAAV